MGWILIFSIVRPFILIPFSFLAIIIVLTHNPLESVLIINVSSSVSAVSVYFISKLFSSKLEKRCPESTLIKRIKDYDFETFFLARLSMLFHFDLLSAVAGVTKIPFSTLFLATFLGFLPESLIFGTLSLSVRNTKFLYILLPLLFVYFMIILLIRKKLSK